MTRRLIPLLALFVALVLVLAPNAPPLAHSQESNGAPPITADNLHQLETIAVIGPGKVRTVTWSPDGSLLVAGGQAGIWLLNTNALNRAPRHITTHHHDEIVNALSFNQEGTLLAAAYGNPTGSGGWEARVWDASTGHEVAFFTSIGMVGGVAWTAEGLLATSDEHGYYLWDVNTRQQTLQLPTGDREWILQQIIANPDGTQLVAFDYSKAQIFDATSGELMLRVDGDEHDIHALTFTPDGRSLAGGTDNGEIQIWDAANGELTQTIMPHTSSVLALDFSPDGTILASTTWDEGLTLWDMDADTALATFTGDRLFGVAFSPDGRFLATASMTDGLQLWAVVPHDTPMPVTLSQVQAAVISAENAAQVNQYPYLAPVTDQPWDEPDNRNGVAWSPDGTVLAAFSRRGVWLQDATDWEHAPVYQPARIDSRDIEVTTIAVTADNTSIIAGDAHGAVWLLDGLVVPLNLFWHNTSTPVQQILLRPDGDVITASGSEIMFYEQSTTTPHVLTTESFFAHAALSPDGNTLAYVHGSGIIYTVDLETMTEINTRLPAHKILDFAPDGTLLTTPVSNLDGTRVPLEWLDLDSGSVVRRAETEIGHHSEISTAIIAADSQLVGLVRGVEGGCNFYLWNTQNPATVTRQSGVTCGLTGVAAFSPDGRHLAWQETDNSYRRTSGALKVAAITPQAMSDAATHFSMTNLWQFAITPDGEWQFAAEEDRIIALHVLSGESRLMGSTNNWHVSALAISPDGHTLMAGDTLGLLYAWDIETAASIVAEVQTAAAVISDIHFISDTQLATSGPPGAVQVWDFVADHHRLAESAVYPPDETLYTASSVVSRDGDWIILGLDSISGPSTAALRVDLVTGQEMLRYNFISRAYGVGVPTLRLSPDDQLLVIGGGGQFDSSQVWDVETGVFMTILYTHAIQDFVFTPDGRYLVVASSPHEPEQQGVPVGRVLLIDTTTWQTVSTLYQGPDMPRRIVYDGHDGYWVAFLDGLVLHWTLPVESEDYVDNALPTPAEMPEVLVRTVCEGTIPSRLQIGFPGRVAFSDGSDLSLRGSAGGDRIGRMPEGATFTVIDGPECQGDFTWWKVELADGRQGWVAEGIEELYFIAPYFDRDLTGEPVCEGAPPSRVAAGQMGYVTYNNGLPLNVRDAPGGAQVAQLAEGTRFTITGGPECQGAFVWWRIETEDGRQGWVAEGSAVRYFIAR